MKKQEWSKLALTSILGLLLSYTFIFLAALPIRYLRLTFGRKTFLLSSVAGATALVGFGLWQWALVYASLCLLIGCYRELEVRRFSIFKASLFAIVATLFANLFILLSYAKFSGLNLKFFLSQKAEPFLTQLRQIPKFQETNMDSVLWYLPSGVVITLMVIVFISLTLSKEQKTTNFSELKMFSLPDWAIWVFIGSLGATFIPLRLVGLNLVAMNLLAITLAGYFFHGLAVFTHFLDRLGIFGIWRLLAYFLVFFQMFIFISGLGILDYWFDFRSQPNNKLTQKTFN